MMPSLRLGIWTTVGYAAIIALATAFPFHQFDGLTGATDMLAAVLPSQIVAVALCVLVVVRFAGWAAVGFGNLDWIGMVWLLPGWLVLAAIGWNIAEVTTVEDLRIFGLWSLSVVLLSTLLIAFGEEVLFRGILLRGALMRLSAPFAMLLSAVLFGLFHLVNGLAGQGAIETSQQVLFAVIVGFFLAPIAIRVGNLWPLIIWHWFWNIAVILGQTKGVLGPFVFFGIAVQAVVSIWLWAEIIRTTRVR